MKKYLKVVFAGSGKRVADRIATGFQNSLSDLPLLCGRYLKLVRFIHLQRNGRNTVVYDESADNIVQTFSFVPRINIQYKRYS